MRRQGVADSFLYRSRLTHDRHQACSGTPHGLDERHVDDASAPDLESIWAENAHPLAAACGVARRTHRDAAAKCPSLLRPLDGSTPSQGFRAPSYRPDLDMAKSLAARLRVWRIRAPRPAGNRNGPNASTQEPGECAG